MSKLTEKDATMIRQKTACITYFRELPVYKYAAMYIGISEQTLKDWRDADPDFQDSLLLAKSMWIKDRARKVKPEFALERLEKDIWSQRVEHTGADGEAIKVDNKATQDLADALKLAVTQGKDANNPPAEPADNPNS